MEYGGENNGRRAGDTEATDRCEDESGDETLIVRIERNPNSANRGGLLSKSVAKAHSAFDMNLPQVPRNHRTTQDGAGKGGSLKIPVGDTGNWGIGRGTFSMCARKAQRLAGNETKRKD